MNQAVSIGPMPPRIELELKRWSRKCQKRNKAAEFESDIIPGWFKAQIEAAIDATDHVEAFSFLKATDPNQRRLERQLQDATQEVFDEFHDDVAEAIAQREEPNYQALSAALFLAIFPIITSAATDRALRVSAQTGIQFDPAVINVDAVAWARSYTFDLVTGLTNTTRKLVRDAVSAFIETPGMTLAKVEAILRSPAEVEGVIKQAFSSTRAEMIAQTETTRAFAQATNIVQQRISETGLQMIRIWETRNDELVCPICGPLNGTPETVWRAQFPDGPPAHPRCRCEETLSALGDDFHLKDAAKRGRDRVAMFADDERLQATARQQLKEFRERWL